MKAPDSLIAAASVHAERARSKLMGQWSLRLNLKLSDFVWVCLRTQEHVNCALLASALYRVTCSCAKWMVSGDKA